MKNPNGYGSVVKLSGNRRNPFVARKTIGWNEKGQPIYKAVGYYPTRKDAMLALAVYNNDPYDIDLNKITFAEVYEKWSTRDFEKMPYNTSRSFRTAYRKCECLYSVRYNQIKAFHFQEVINKCDSHSTQAQIKTLFANMDRFALELDIIVKSNSQLVKVDPIPESSKTPFTAEEIKTVWKNKDVKNMDLVLILIHTGFRINEFLKLKIEDVDLENRTIIGGIKTKSGKNRIVPIHDDIFDYVKKRCENNKTYLVETPTNKAYKDSNFYELWSDLMKVLRFYHTVHECRHTFRSRLDSAGANKVCIDLMMGHKSKEVGERVYTHKTIEELKQALALVTN